MVKKSVNYWSFPGGLEGKLDPREAIHLAKKHGFEAIELGLFESGGVDFSFDQAQCEALRSEAEKLGVPILSTASGIYWSRALADAEPSARDQASKDLQALIERSAWLGAQTLLTIPGAVDVFFLPQRTAQSYEHVLDLAREGLQKLLPFAVQHGVRLGIENVWNRVFLSPLELRDFVDGFQSPHIGAYVDVANVLPFGYPEQWLRILGHRVIGIHFKDFRRAVGTAEGFVDLLEGDVNWPEVMAAISEIGYKGPVACEMIPCYKHHPMVRVENASRAMDAILGRD